MLLTGRIGGNSGKGELGSFVMWLYLRRRVVRWSMIALDFPKKRFARPRERSWRLSLSMSLSGSSSPDNERVFMKAWINGRIAGWEGSREGGDVLSMCRAGVSDARSFSNLLKVSGAICQTKINAATELFGYTHLPN